MTRSAWNTGSDFDGLKELPHFESLGVETEFDQAALEHLKGLTRLYSLDLVGTKVTDEGVNKLQQALPGCSIVMKR